jgi:hypothetical protein
MQRPAFHRRLHPGGGAQAEPARAAAPAHAEIRLLLPELPGTDEQAFKSKIIFLLDEVDNLVIMQRGDWELFRMLRASSNKGACQYIIAGFREAMREQYMLDSPFYNFAQEIRLSEFTRQQARELIATPWRTCASASGDEEEVVAHLRGDRRASEPDPILLPDPAAPPGPDRREGDQPGKPVRRVRR